MTDKKVAVVIPAYNEEKTIGIITKILSNEVIVIVVDDGSTDNTANKAKMSGSYVIKHKKNKGYDSALETGLLKALFLNADYVITLDADGQHNPMLIKKFIRKLDSGVDQVIGKRIKMQRWSESLFSAISYQIWGYRDLLCGMKGYKCSSIRNLKNINTYKSIGTEIFIRLSATKSKTAEIEINTLERKGKSKFGNGVIANLKIIYALIIGVTLFITLNFKKISERE